MKRTTSEISASRQAARDTLTGKRSNAVQVRVTERPYILTFDYAQSGAYPLSSAEAQRLIDSYPVVKATANMVTLLSDQPDRMKSFLRPATLGGGAAFEVTR